MEVDIHGDGAAAMKLPLAGAARGLTGHRLLLTLLLLQAIVAALVLWPFLTGERYFAYLDIGSDTYTSYTALAVDLARLFGREGWTGWSFNMGLGAPVAIATFSDAFRLLTQVAGPDNVPALRIWVYLLKIALGGVFFLLLARELVERNEAALITALAYSFCGYMVVNGVWDSETNAFVFFPLVLWSIVRHLRNGDVVSFPLALGAATLSGVFFVSAVVSLAIAFVACVALSAQPRPMMRAWLTGVLPLALLGFLIGAPTALPMTLQLLDSPRVAGPEALLARMAGEAIRLTEPGLVVQQLSALFHKDLLGSANAYRGYMNYLEGPGFYVGLLPLLLLPQLWTSGPSDRRALVVGLVGIGIYMLVPAFRLSAFGFAAPYFRVTTLWVTLALLLLGLRALDRTLLRVDWRMLLLGVGAVGGLLAFLAWVLQAVVWPAHVWKLVVLLILWTLLLSVSAFGWIKASRLATLVLALTTVEAVAVAWTSFIAWRPTAGPGAEPFKDQTLDALAAIRKADPGVHRIEKTYVSASQTDAAAQDYMGVRSYYYHGSAAFDFYRSMDMLPNFGPVPPVNFTNWLDGPNDRAVLHSVLGVRYVIGKERLDWPGFELAHSGPGWYAYRNELALPLGVVQTRQVTRSDMRMDDIPSRKRAWLRDLAMLNAVVLEAPLTEWGTPFDLAKLVKEPGPDLPSDYVRPAENLQRTGLQIESFEHHRISGRISPTERGILVFSIPDYRGWSLRIDGQPAPLMRANFGMLATPVTAGQHRVELSYELPGLRAGMLLGLAALLAVVLVHRRKSALR
jgi:uncharacterized membrane protein YfhO